MVESSVVCDSNREPSRWNCPKSICGTQDLLDRVYPARPDSLHSNGYPGKGTSFTRADLDGLGARLQPLRAMNLPQRLKSHSLGSKSARVKLCPERSRRIAPFPVGYPAYNSAAPHAEVRRLEWIGGAEDLLDCVRLARPDCRFRPAVLVGARRHDSHRSC